MKTYLFNKENMSFYPFSLKDDYIKSGTWPENGVEVDDDVFEQFSGESPAGKMRGASGDGMPAWVDIPPPTPEELFAVAAQKKSILLAEASSIIAPLRDASDGGYIDDADVAVLAAWQKYRYALTKVDPAKPVWPERPAS